MEVIFRILLARSPILELGDYMCCVHVKASKPSPPQSRSDCTIIFLTPSSTTWSSQLPAVRPPFSQDAERLRSDSKSVGFCSASEGRTMSKFIILPPCTLGPSGSWHCSTPQVCVAELSVLLPNQSIFVYHFIFRQNQYRRTLGLFVFLIAPQLTEHFDRCLCWHTLICNAVTHFHTNSRTLTHTQPHNTSANFKEGIEDLEPRNAMQGRAHSVSPWQFFTLTYRHCITFQYFTEVCRQRTADTSKGCSKSTLLLGTSELCRSRSWIGQTDAGRGQAWLKTLAGILKNGFSISHFDELKLSGQPVGRGFLVHCGVVNSEG